MIQLTPFAASMIERECRVRSVPQSGGLRIAPRSSGPHGDVEALVVRFVSRPRASDTVIRHGEASVFVAPGVERLVGPRLLDAEGSASRPKFVLRSP